MTTDILPTEYTPKSIDEFFGPAKAIGQRLMRSAEMCLKRGAPAAHLLVGPSGSGKTSLMRFAVEVAFQCHKWNVHEFFGQDLDIAAAQDIAFQIKLTSLYPGFRAFCFDEFDKMTSAARDRILEFVGEAKQPRNTLIIATSNMEIEQFDAMERNPSARGRLSSRFQVHSVPCPTHEDVTPLAEIWLPPKEARDLCVLSATGPSGKVDQPINVRAFLKDCTTYLQR